MIYEAWLTKKLGRESPWLHAEPPAAWRAAYEAREAARHDAASEVAA